MGGKPEMINMKDLKGRIALVTGGGRGIGRACSIALASAGADIAVNFHTGVSDAGQVKAMVENLGCRCVIIQADVSVSADIDRMIKSVEDGLGKISILVNNAGFARSQALDEVTESDWDEIVGINLKSVFFITRTVLPGMRSQKWGRIINMSSTAAQLGGIVGPHYTAAKAGVIGLTHYFSSQLIKDGITVNAIAPGQIETDMLVNNSLANTGSVPAGRLGEPEEVAEAVLMLARNGFISGQTINVNGGMYYS
jgi:3-oxoacyl-[acyl-carrier protein] reductase